MHVSAVRRILSVHSTPALKVQGGAYHQAKPLAHVHILSCMVYFGPNIIFGMQHICLCCMP